MQDIILSPSDFVAVFNQTLEFAYPTVVIEGELSNFRIAKNRWLYFNLQDEASSVAFFGSATQLPGPLEDGLRLRVVGAPRLHPRYGFTVNVLSLAPVGEGSIKKAADLLARKLEAEGLFVPERKRPLPVAPQRIALITAAKSAAAADFLKVLNDRWAGVEVLMIDTYVQGDKAPGQLQAAIAKINRLAKLPEVLVITRGGGSTDDLAAFSDERVVRAVAASRVPTLVAIGHEVDISLSEMAADAHASTPTAAAAQLVPDKQQVLLEVRRVRETLSNLLATSLTERRNNLSTSREYLTSQVFSYLKDKRNEIAALRKLSRLFDPKAALKRGYAIVSKGGRHISRASQLRPDDKLGIEFGDDTINAIVVSSR